MLIPTQADLAHIAIPFRFAFRHALAERKIGEGVLLSVRDAEGRVGRGECAPRKYVSGETAASAVAALSRRVPALLGRRFASFEELCEHLSEQAAALPRDEHAAFCALELALLDLAGKVFGRPAGEPLGPVCTPRVAYSGVVSAGGAEEASKVCAQMRKLGVSRAKVKVGGRLEEDLEVLNAVRETLGEQADLRVDANGAWDAKTALARVQAFEPFRLQGLEQPCAADDIEGLAWLSERSSVPVIADESLVSLEDARRLIRSRACHVFNVRISKCGGLLQSGRIRDLGREAGIDTMLGAHVGETAILAAAGRQFATRTEGLRFAEGCYGRLLLEADVSAAMDLEPGGIGRATSGDGLGLDVDLERIAPFVVAGRLLT
jgi:L-alanine-DL-glutamate epimerase-like enolase superfamily enzyme